MMRVLGILALVVGLWAALEIQQEGLAGAFNGRLAFLDGSIAPAAPGDPERSARYQNAQQRAREAVEQAHAEAAARRERLLGE